MKCSKWLRCLLCFLLCLSFLFSSLTSPDVYKADSQTVTFENSDLTFISQYYNGSDWVTYDFYNNAASMGTQIIRFRFFILLPIDLSDCSIDYTLKLGFSGGTLAQAYTVFSGGFSPTTSVNSSDAVVGVIDNNSVVSFKNITTSSLTSNVIKFEFYDTGRTSTNFQAVVNWITIRYYEVDPVVEQMENLNTSSSNIFEAVGNMLLHIADIVVDVSNMPVAIKNNLTSLFDGIGDLLDGGFSNLPSNLASALSDYFLDLPSRLKEALSSCFETISFSIDNLLSFLPDDIAEVLEPVFDDFGLDFVSMITWLSSIDDRIETLANNFAAGLGLELPSDYWDGFVGIFIPGEDDLQVVFDKFDVLFEEKFGFFYEIVDLVSLYVNTLTSTSYGFTPEGDGHFDATIDLPVYTVDLGACDFTIGGWSVPLIPDGLDSYFDAFRSGVNVLCTFLFINGMRMRFDSFLGVR